MMIAHEKSKKDYFILLGMKISYVQFDTKINGSHFSFSENLTQILHE